VLVQRGRAQRVLDPDDWLIIALIVARAPDMPTKDQARIVRNARKNGVAAAIELAATGPGQAE